ncbi:Ragulator complex protein LAMTOR3 [Pilobolus umbonatus]|nr:Ragulator complex protein LAMTOR3 [Pilobolus umbonatus]
MEAQFNDVCSKHFCNGLLVAIVTDRDGVILLKSASDKATDEMIEAIIPTTFAIANNQASKLGLQRNKSIITVYELYQIIQLDQTPLVITLILNTNANTGLFLNLGDALLELIEPLAEALNEKQ